MKKERKNNELNEQQLIFCKEVAKGTPANFAALKAGYGGGDLRKAGYQAKRLIKNELIEKTINELGGNVGNKKQRTAEDVLKDVEFGVQQAKKYNDLNNLYKFLSLEAKIFGLEKENLNVTGSMDCSVFSVLKEIKTRSNKMENENND